MVESIITNVLNRTIEKGQYRFVKELPVKIARLGSFVPQALALFGKTLGEKYISHADLESYTTYDKKTGFVALKDSSVIGAAICEILDSIDQLPESNRIRELLPKTEYFSYGLLQSIAVEKAYQGMGTGTRLAAECINWLKNRKTTSIIALAWIEDKCNASGVLESQGFISYGNLDKYWYNDSIIKGYKCPKCGNPCFCTAVLYVL